MPDPIMTNWLISERIRYLGAFSSVWSAFNDWYRRDPRFAGTDRKCLSAIQALPVVDPLVVSFERVCSRQHNRFQRPLPSQQDAMTIGAVEYSTQSLFSSLVKEVMLHPTLGPLVWITGRPKPSGLPTNQVSVTHVPEATYFAWYKELHAAEAESECMADSSISVQKALASLGIEADGCAFFAGRPTATTSLAIVASLEKRLAQDQTFQTARMFCSATRPNRFPCQRFAIAIELLYLIRNNIMHGVLSPTELKNDLVGRAAQDLLYTWLVNFAA
jgi:hypothetical protein